MKIKILLTGSTGYIGRRLLPLLIRHNYFVVCVVRDRRRFDFEDFSDEELASIEVLEVDFLQKDTLSKIPGDIQSAYYFLHAMTGHNSDFEELECQLARNFVDFIDTTQAKQVIYLSGIANDQSLSKHLKSRKKTEEILHNSKKPLTTLRAAIIVGSGSASFEIIRDLVEKLPVMITPRWLNSKCQPISIRNVLEYLIGVLLLKKSYNGTYDIAGHEVLTYKEMLMGYARVRKLKRLIITLPLLTPKLSSHWLYFVTSVSFSLARHLVNSLKNDCVANPDLSLGELVPTKTIDYQTSIKRTLKIQSHENVISSWKDSIYNSYIQNDFLDFHEVPKYGVLSDERQIHFDKEPYRVWDNIWKIGGARGWYFADSLWRIRGLLDKLVGGVGLRRGRRSEIDLKRGDALDFWRVIDADPIRQRLLLFAEMKLPGEAWLEFRIKSDKDKYVLYQTATFRPRGTWGRLYWYMIFPMHEIVFQGMARALVSYRKG